VDVWRGASSTTRLQVSHCTKKSWNGCNMDD
jgi:hypothetical protein